MQPKVRGNVRKAHDLKIDQHREEYKRTGKISMSTKHNKLWSWFLSFFLPTYRLSICSHLSFQLFPCLSTSLTISLFLFPFPFFFFFWITFRGNKCSIEWLDSLGRPKNNQWKKWKLNAKMELKSGTGSSSSKPEPNKD